MRKKKIVFMALTVLLIVSVAIGSMLIFKPPKVEAAADYIDASNVQGLQMEKTATDNGDGTYVLNLETFTTESVEYVRDILYSPVDIIFVADCSNSMSFYMDSDVTAVGSENSRMYHSKEAMKTFVKEIYLQSKAHENLDCRLSMISYGHSYAYVDRPYDGHLNVIDNYNTIIDAINDLSATALGGCTQTQKAMEEALSVLNNIKGQSGYSMTDRKRVVILFTDGAPTEFLSSWVDQFNEDVANGAIAAANTIKDSAYCYTVGIGDGIDNTPPVPSCDTSVTGEATDTKNNYGRFLQYVSSNYNEATTLQGSATITAPEIGQDEYGNPVYQSFCYTTTDEDILSAAFKSIAEEIVVKRIITENVDSSTVIKDYITPYFELDTSKEIEVYTYNYIGRDANGNRLFETEGTEYSNAKLEVISDVVYIKNLNYADSTVKDITGLNGNSTYSGYKYSVKIPIKVKAGFLGGNNVPTNTNESGVYSDEDDLCWGTFDVPTVDVQVKAFTVTVPDKNIYANTYYQESDFFDNNVTCEFDGGVIEFSKENYGLESWQNEFVEISRENTMHSSFDISDSGMYGISLCTSTLPTDLNNIVGITISSGSDSNKQTQSAKSKVNIFYPEVTLKDVTVPVGTDIYDVFEVKYYSWQWVLCVDVSDEEIKWKNENIYSDFVNMIGEPVIDFEMEFSGYKDMSDKSCEDYRIFYDTPVNIVSRKYYVDDNGYVTPYDVYGVTIVSEKCFEDEAALPDGYNLWIHPVGYCELTIQKSGSSSADTNQSHMFHIINEHDNTEYVGYESINDNGGYAYDYWLQDEEGNDYIDESIDVVVDPVAYDNGEYNNNFGYWLIDKYGEVQIKEDRRCENDIDMNVIVHGNESVTILLPAGEYTIIEDDDWSWRYDAAQASQTVTLSADNPSQTIVFENSRTNSDGLSGGSWIVNEFATEGFVRKPEEITE